MQFIFHPTALEDANCFTDSKVRTARFWFFLYRNVAQTRDCLVVGFLALLGVAGWQFACS